MTNKRKRIRLATLCVGATIALLAIVAGILLQMNPQSCRLAFLTQSLTGELPVPSPQFTGVWRTWYKNGRLASAYMYEDGERRGTFTTWHPNGQKAEAGRLLKSIPYDDVSGAYENTYDGALLRWYPDGKPKEKANFRSGVLDGRYEYWDNFDKGYWKRKDLNYKDGKEDGVCIRWDMPLVRTEITYVAGQRHGWGKQVSEASGDLNWEEYREDDACKIYRKYRAGQLIEERKYEEAPNKTSGGDIQ